jgi:hypothetical protein
LQGRALLFVKLNTLAGSLALNQCIVHFCSCIKQTLLESQQGFFLLGFGYFQVGYVLSPVK